MPRNTSGLLRGGPGRPKAARGLRAELVRRYGQDGKPLVDRLAQLSIDRNHKIALDATELLLAYLAGKPVNHTELNGHVVPAVLVLDANPGAA